MSSGVSGTRYEQARDWIKAIVGSIVGTIVLVAACGPWLDMHTLARYLLVVGAVSLIIWFGLPWILVGLTYITWVRIGKMEDWIRNHLLEMYPSSHFLRTMFDSSYHTDTVYAVTAYVLHPDRTKLLMILHRTHGRWLPPGGRLMTNELHHDAILARVSSETGLPKDKLHFCEDYCPVCNNHIAEDEGVEVAPKPWIVQTEKVEQRGGIPYHYDFIYVIESDADEPLKGSQNPRWLSMHHMTTLKKDVKPFPNVENLCREILDTRGHYSATGSMERT